METHKRREWVKTAAIIFLLILLALTFFSNTIMNMTLAEVSTVAIADGSISAKVRATGKVAAVGNNEVKAEGTRTIAAVKVKEGQEVSEGDILFVMGEAGSEELEVAQDARDSAYYSYERAKVSYPINDGSAAYDRAYNAYCEAMASENDAWAEYHQASQYVDDPNYVQAKTKRDAAEKELEQAEFNLAAYQNNCLVDMSQKEELSQTRYVDWQMEMDPTERENKKIAYDQAFADYNVANISYQESLSPSNSYAMKVEEKRAEYYAADAYVASFETDISAYRAKYDAASSARIAAETALTSAEAAYKNAYEAYAQSVAQANINAEEAKQTLDKKQTKLDNLQGVGEDINVYAKVNGIISSIGFSSGDKVTKDDVMCVIEVPDMGYTLEATVTKDQANRLKVGDVGEQANYYWGKSTTGTITSIKADKRAPQEKRIITFELEGDVTNGQEITLSVGSKTASYDYIVPKSAVKSDNNGSFVLVIDSKSNALGNRYFARRVNVEILAEDDSYRAISGDIGYGDFVITNSSTKVNSGDQVRLADTQ